MRSLFERGLDTRRRDGARSRSPTCGCARRSCRRSSSTRPATSASTRRSPRSSTGRTRSRRGSCSSRTSTRSSGPDEPIIYPEHLTEELDYELELAVIIGKAGKHFDADEAESYIAGYTIFNDITARDIQRREMRSGVFSFCKAIDTFCPLGPWIVTPDEVGDAHDLAMALRVNGELRQESHSGNMSVTIPEIIAHYSPLGYSAGDIISTGTVSGVAGFSENAAELYLRPGDVVECEIERIGKLSNPVISWEAGLRGAGAPAAALVSAWAGRSTQPSSSACAR